MTVLRFCPAELAGAFVIELEPHSDERGFFARSFCEREFAERGLVQSYPQHNVSWNRLEGTLRGMHFNAPPHEEAKLVSCTSGAILDVIVDLRRDSPTRGEWISVELSAENRRMLYVPKGFAHGFLTQSDGAEVFYRMSAAYVPSAARGIRWNDPALGIRWPRTPSVVSERDASHPDYDPEAAPS